MMDMVTLQDAGDNYQICIPGQFLRESGLLIEEVEDAPLGETSLAVDHTKVLLEFDPESRKITFQLPEPPEDKPTPAQRKPTTTPGEEAVLNNS